MSIFARRTAKEILRDPLSLFFGIGFPVVLLILLSIMNRNLPVDLFALSHLTPGMAVFGLSFMSLFSAQLIAKDRSSSLLIRLFTTPMTAADYILGYVLPLLPMAVAQAVICYGTALLLGLPWTGTLIWAVCTTLPCALIFIGIGLLCGSLFSEKAVTGICGALLTNLTAWLSGTWFSLELLGGGFRRFADMLPFVHAVDMGRAALQGEYAACLPHLAWVLGYGAVILAAAVWAFRSRMHAD